MAATKKKKKLAEEEEARSKAAREAVTNPPCAFCGKASFETCTNCMATHYCSKACQVKHWPKHKIPCKESPIYKKNQELAALKRKLAEQEEALGVDSNETLSTVGSIGILLTGQGKLSEAETYYRRAIEGYERTLGRDHPNTLSAVCNLGLLLHQQRKPDLAEPLLRRAIEGLERTLGRDHPNTLSAVNSMGLLSRSQRSRRGPKPQLPRRRGTCQRRTPSTCWLLSPPSRCCTFR